MKGLEKVSGEKLREKLKKILKQEIEEKRNILNRMVISGVDKKDILKFSQELDKLIGRYHWLDLNIK